MLALIKHTARGPCLLLIVVFQIKMQVFFMCTGISGRKWQSIIWRFPGENLGQHSWNLPTTARWDKRSWSWNSSFYNGRNTRCQFLEFSLPQIHTFHFNAILITSVVTSSVIDSCILCMSVFVLPFGIIKNVCMYFSRWTLVSQLPP